MIAKPSGSSPSAPIARPTSSSTPRPAIDVGDGLDAGDRVAQAGDDLAGAAAVPGDAVVEDVAEPVPLGRALQRHRDHVVGTADAVREALDAGRGVGAGVEHGVHRVGPAPPALLRAVHVEALRQRERDARAGPGRAASRRLASSRKFIVPRTSSAPHRPQLEHPLGRGGDGALGVGPVESAGRSRAAQPDALSRLGSCRRRRATQSAMKVLTWAGGPGRCARRRPPRG